MPRFTLVCLLTMAALSGQVPGQNAPVAGAVIRGYSYDHLKHTYEAELYNTGTRAITAYSLRFIHRFPDGSENAGGTSSSEMLESEPVETALPPRAGIQRGWLRPGQSIPLRTGISFASNSSGPSIDLRLELAAVVYDDGSAEGVQEEIDRILRRRRVLAAELEKYLPRVQALRESSDPLADLREMYKEATASVHELDEDPARESTYEEMLVRSARQQVQQIFRSQVQMLSRQNAKATPAALEHFVSSFERRGKLYRQASQR